MSRPARKRAYGQNLPLVDVFPFPIFKTSTPSTSDSEFEVGQLWVYKNGDARTVYVYSGDKANGDAVWSISSPGASDVDTMTGDAGTALPAAGNIQIKGGTNITTAAATSIVTVNLDADITLATSVTCPLYTVAAATDLAITAVTGQDVIIKMGDNA